VIDDEAPIRRFLRVPLDAEGHCVTEAATARDSILAAAREAPG
jgi:two-component system, OmpR family, KDP operon response regulator KdpE